MVGIPGSGKTTIARQRYPNALRISLDDLRLMFTGKPFDVRVEPAVSVASEAVLQALLAFSAARQLDVLHDATNVSRAKRAGLIALARRHEVSPVAVYVPVPVKLAIDRNQKRPFPVPVPVILRFSRILEPPSLAEGFDQLIVMANEVDHDGG